jgi:hypothetical protein
MSEAPAKVLGKIQNILDKRRALNIPKPIVAA